MYHYMNERPSRSWLHEWIPETIPSVQRIATLLVLFTVGIAVGNVAAGQSIIHQVWLVWVVFPAVLVLSVSDLKQQ